MNWDTYFLDIASAVSKRSKDRSTKVGCVIVGPDKEIRATGYNGFPRGIYDEAPERHERPEKYLWTEHAERNAIYAAARVGTPLRGSTAYTLIFPCMDCARCLIQAGIVELVTYIPPDEWLTARDWRGEWFKARKMMQEAGLDVRLI